MLTLSIPVIEDFTGRWWICGMRPRYAERMVKELHQAGGDFFLPLVPDRSGPAPLFLNYIFLNGDAARDCAARSAAKSKSSIAPVNDQKLLSRELHQIAEAMRAGKLRKIRAMPRVRQKVRIIDGPFMNTEGVVDRVGSNVVYLFVQNTLGGGEMDVSPDLLEVIHDN